MADQPQDSPTQPEQKAPDDGQSVKPTPSPEDLKRARRRKLLKGLAAGVPAIITLQSGAALAGKSIGDFSCIASSGRTGNFTGWIANITKRCTAVGNIGNDMNWVSPDDAAIWGAANAGPAGVGAEWCLPYMKAGGTLGVVGTNFGANLGTTGVNAWPAANFYAVKQSCWTSFYS
jgi:hypothetical protein